MLSNERPCRMVSAVTFRVTNSEALTNSRPACSYLMPCLERKYAIIIPVFFLAFEKADRNCVHITEHRVKYLRLLIGIGIGVFFIWLLVRRLPFQALSQSFKEMRYPLLIPSLVSVIVGFAVRAYRWGYFFTGENRIPYRTLYAATMIGYMGNSLLPARAGEFIRAYLISRKHRHISMSTSFATLVAERILDGIVLMILLGLTLLVLPRDKPIEIPKGTFFERPVTITHGHLLKMACGAGGIFALALVIAVLFYVKGDAVARVFGRIFSVFSDRAADRVSRFVTSFASGFDIIRNKKRLALVGILSLLVWGPAALSVYPLLHAFPGATQWPWYTVIVVLAVVCVGLMIPAPPGFVGTFDASCVAALFLCAPVPYGTAVAISLILHILNIIAVVAIGVICLRVENLSFTEVARSAGAGSQ